MYPSPIISGRDVKRNNAQPAVLILRSAGVDLRFEGSVLRLSLPPETRPKQPCTGGPQVSGHTRCPRWAAMGHLVRLIAFQTAVRPTEIVEAHRQPTHPAVRAPGLRTR